MGSNCTKATDVVEINADLSKNRGLEDIVDTNPDIDIKLKGTLENFKNEEE